MPPRVDTDNNNDNSAFSFETQHSPVNQSRGEVSRLQKQLYDLRLRLEEVECERDSHAAMVGDLKKSFRALRQDRVDKRVKTLLEQVTEISKEINTDQDRMKGLLEEENDVRPFSLGNDMMTEYIGFIRTIDDDLDRLKIELKTVTVERESFSAKCKSQEDTIDKLTKDMEAKDRQIEKMEDVVRSLKNERRAGGQGMSIIKKKQEEIKERYQPPRRTLSLRKVEDRFFSMFDNESPSPKKKSSTTRSIQATLQASTSSSVEEGRTQTKENRFLCPPLEGGQIQHHQDYRSDVKASTSSKSLAVRLVEGSKETAHLSPCRRKETIEVIIAGSVGLYSGSAIDGVPSGVGSIRFSNGDIYLGQVMDGKVHGKGTLYTKAGLSRGRFENNVFMG